MKKFTRRSYNRKLIVFALSMFMAISLVTVGFAAWVMSAVTNAQHDADVVKVAVISDASMTVTIDQWDAEQGKWVGNVLTFDAAEGDNTGRIRAAFDSEGVQQGVENLTMTISGKVTHPEMLTGLKVTIDIADTGLDEAMAAGYIKAAGLRDLAWTDGKLIIDILTPEYLNWNATDGTFSYTLQFIWGDYFGGLNPSEFYDSTTVKRIVDGAETVTGASISDEQMMTEMQQFRAVLANGWDSTIPGFKTDYDKNNQTVYEGTVNILVEASADAN
ncbi:MAG: hypothetical protein IJW29_08565 [Clostridia bacterium]|nr:hypothetical protein [Clostridia bacterium]